MANANITVKLTLDEANTIRDALQFRKEDRILHLTGGSDDTDENRHEIGRIDLLLRRDF